MIHEHSAGAIIFREIYVREYLIIQEHVGHWFFAKGHLENGETNYQAAKREIFEEIGQVVDFIPGYFEQISYPTGNNKKKTVSFYLVKMGGEEVRHNPEEIRDAKWFTLEDSLKTLDHDNSRQLLKKTDSWINEWMKKQ